MCVGFGLSAEEGRQVACLAENTGGKYLQASDAAALKDALAEAVASPNRPTGARAGRAEPAPEPRRRLHPSPRSRNTISRRQPCMAAGGAPLAR